MAGPRLTRVLPFAYLLGISLLAGLLAVVGALLDRMPFMPDAIGRGYGAGALRLVAMLTTPLDAWAPRAPGLDSDARHPSRPRRRHN